MNRSDKYCRSKRRVCFSTEADIFFLWDVAPASTMTNEEKDSAWYTNGDMIHMREEARISARRLRIIVDRMTSSPPPFSGEDESQTCGSDLNRRLDEQYPPNFPPSTVINDDTDETCRGLEFRISPGRQLNRYIVASSIMTYQRRNKQKLAIAVKNGKPDIQFLTEIASINLGSVSAKYSRWARDVAIVRGKSDFEAVYGKTDTLFSISSFELLDRSLLKRKRTNEFAYQVEGCELNMQDENQLFDAHTSSGNCCIPIDRIRCNRLPFNAF